MDLPVTVIGGYLGAGKTTLVNHLLRHADGVRYAVLVNEFGDIAIDADLIEAEDDGMIAISGGCVCCAYGSDLVGALDDILAMSPRPDHILLEASGVALPASIATTMGLVAGLRTDAVLVLADAEQVRANAANPYLGDTIDRQLAQADIVLVTKADLVPDLSGVTVWLRDKAPRARVLPVVKGAVEASAVIGAVPLARRGLPAKPDAHGLFDSVVLTPDAPVDAEALAQALATDPGVTRAKGFVPTASGLALIHVVGPRAEVEPATGTHTIGLVCIGLKDTFDADRLRALLP